MAGRFPLSAMRFGQGAVRARSVGVWRVWGARLRSPRERSFKTPEARQVHSTRFFGSKVRL